MHSMLYGLVLYWMNKCRCLAEQNVHTGKGREEFIPHIDTASLMKAKTIVPCCQNEPSVFF